MRDGQKVGRREFLKRASMATAAATIPTGISKYALAAPVGAPIVLAPGPAELRLFGADDGATNVWAYNGEVPGPLVRLRQNQTARIRLDNGLKQPTTIHWHGLRIDNAMDGVANLTQPAVKPNAAFNYEFTPPDAGTFWYHSHARSWEQVARGLAGVLIVDEAEAQDFDRDLICAIDDWRLMDDLSYDEQSLGRLMDWSHGGRLGNALTVNGSAHTVFKVGPGERIRFRLVNIATARIFNLDFGPLTPVIIAVDGQPIAPRRTPEGRLTISPGQRYDLSLDIPVKSANEFVIFEVSGRGRHPAAIIEASAPARRARSKAFSALPPNRLEDPLTDKALRVPLIMEGGAMGRLESALVDGKRMGLREMAQRHNLIWAFNGVAGMTETPLFRSDRNRHVVIEFQNQTGWPHAMHLHGHHAKVISRNGRATPSDVWRDTILLNRGERAEVAFVADNPGRWMIHCHMLGHQVAGMTSWFEVVA
jgi:FtsP/CotA-like multicopper oxidase with cupredoxin domain